MMSTLKTDLAAIFAVVFLGPVLMLGFFVLAFGVGVMEVMFGWFKSGRA